VNIGPWIAFALIMLVIVGLAVAFSRQGLAIKPDSERKPPSDQGGQPPTVAEAYRTMLPALYAKIHPA